MDNQTPRNQNETVDAADAGGEKLPPVEADAEAAVAPMDPGIAAEFSAIVEDYGRERSRKGIGTGMAAPAVLCTVALCCALLGGFYVIASAILYAVSVLWLIRVWKILPQSTLLDDSDKVKWKFRLKFTAVYLSVAGLIIAGLIIAFVATLWSLISQANPV